MTTFKKIFILDDVISQEECFILIDYYQKVGPSHQWETFFPRSLYQDDFIPYFFVNKILNIVSSLVNVRLDVVKSQIVFWPTESLMFPHKDVAKNETIFTSITYLNCNFSGGKTYFVDDMEFVPRIGRTVCFDGKQHLHGVSKITNGNRYTLPIWYKLVS